MLRAGSVDWRSIRSPRRETCAKAVKIHRELAAPRRHHGIGLPASPHRIRPVRRAVGRGARLAARRAPHAEVKARIGHRIPVFVWGLPRSASGRRRSSAALLGARVPLPGPVPSGAQQRVLVGPKAIVGADARDLSSAHELRLDFASDRPASGRASPTVPLLALGQDQSPGCRAAWARLLRRQDIAPDSDSDPKLAALGIPPIMGYRGAAEGVWSITLSPSFSASRLQGVPEAGVGWSGRPAHLRFA